MSGHFKMGEEIRKSQRLYVLGYNDGLNVAKLYYRRMWTHGFVTGVCCGGIAACFRYLLGLLT